MCQNQLIGLLQNPEELREETRKADVGLTLAIAASENYLYSLANKFFAYIHAEVPSINMDFPVYSRICKEYKVGICIDELTPESVQKAIREIVSDESRYLEFKSECRRAKSECNWEKESIHFLELMGQVI